MITSYYLRVLILEGFVPPCEICQSRVPFKSGVRWICHWANSLQGQKMDVITLYFSGCSLERVAFQKFQYLVSFTVQLWIKPT